MKLFQRRKAEPVSTPPATRYVATLPDNRHWRIGKVGQSIAPGYGWCYKCKTPWLFVEAHTTRYTDQDGMFPLCEQCWQELGTAEARVPFYLALWHKWADSSRSLDEAREYEELWPKIEAAVRAEADA